MLIFLTLCLYIGKSDWTFMSMGDWGGDDAPRYSKESQCDAAVGMNAVAAQYGVDTILAVGDNFYHSGVTHQTAQKRFERTFDEVYSGDALQGATFYAIAGNHDHRGEVSAQIGYPNPRWYFPNHWYSFTKHIGGGKTAHFVMIDTVLLSGESFHDYERDVFVSATGPLNKALAESQWEFIEEQIEENTSDFLFVVGHYPVYSPCSHGSTRDLYENLEPLLERHQVTAYIAGHDHCASFVDPETHGGTVYPLNGMGDTCCYRAKKKKKLDHLLGHHALKFSVTDENVDEYGYPDSGFSSYTLTDDGYMITRFHDQDGNVMWDTTTASHRATGEIDLSVSAPTSVSDYQNEPLFLVGLVFATCILGFFSTLCISQTCKRLKGTDKDLTEDLMLS